VLCKCLLNNRTRASIQILEEILGATRSDRIYVAEQVTPLFVTLAKRFPKLIGSEYLAAKVPFGACDERAVRNESVTKLTFQDNSFHYVLNFDVLEHIPNPEEGLREIHPVLAPGGKLLLSVPFLPMRQETQVRAEIAANGNIRHLMEPQYHGDPVSESGCLCF
jgi:SAM-dependent methyltransferase